MCNIYALKTNRQAIIDLVKATRVTDAIGNVPEQPGILSDYSAPIVRNFESGRELTKTRCGMPKPALALKGKKTDSGVTNSQ